MNFPPGVTAKQVQVTVDDDALDEDDETFNVQLVAATGAQVDDGLGLGTIVDDDPEPSLSMSSPIVTEGNAGTKNVQVHYRPALAEHDPSADAFTARAGRERGWHATVTHTHGSRNRLRF